MIIWLNGAFGAGKTTLSDELRSRITDHVYFDPEEVGFMMREFVPLPDSGDFQDLPVWRRLVADTAIALRAHYPGTIIVPMTLVVPEYREEIFSRIEQSGERVHHFWLDVSADELTRRITEQVLMPEDPERDADARAFRLKNIERCVAARQELPAGTVILETQDQKPEALAEIVLQSLSGRN